MPYNITLQGADYADVPAVLLPKTGGGTARFYGDLAKYVIRPDAELIQTYTYDKWIVEDEEKTIPAYTTTDTTLLASASLSPTITLNYADYNYYEVVRMLAIPTYSVTSKAKGRVEYWAGTTLYELTEIAANTFAALLDGTKYTSRNVSTIALSNPKLLYWSSGTAVTPYGTASYGIFEGVTAPSISSGVWTIKSPALKIRGHATYLTSTYMNALTDIRYQYVIEIYRAPKNNLNINGWGNGQGINHVLDCVNSTTHKLT